MSAPRRGLILFSAFSAAVFGAVYLLPPDLWPWLGLGLLAPAGLCFLGKGPRLTLACLGAAAALLWCGAFRLAFFGPAEALDGRRTRVSVYLSEGPTASQYGGYAKGWVVEEGRIPVQGILYADETLLDLGPGDRVTALCHCSQTALAPESRFTAQATRGVFVRLEAKGSLEVEKAQRIPWWCLPRWWAGRLSESIAHAVSPAVSGFLNAMVTGDRSGVDDALNTDMARAGISHLVAVSGMHVCFLVNLLTLFTGYDPRRRMLAVAPVLVLFALAVGGSPSVMRACCLQLSMLLAELLGRETERWTSLTGTLALLLLLDPFSAGSVSLQLSFAAVAGMGVATPRVERALSRFRFSGTGRVARLANAVIRFFANLLAATLGAMVFTVPLAAWYFGTLSLAAPLTNLLVLPVASFLFAGTLIVGLVGLVLPGVAAALSLALNVLGGYVLCVVRGISAIPYSAVTLTEVYYPVALAGIYALLGIALFWRGQRRRFRVLALCAVAMLGGAMAFTRLELAGASLTAAVLDVGQGQCVVLSSRGETAVIDCGGNRYDDPGDLCADYLNARGENRVDKLILTHYHSDHANGLDALFRRLEVGEVVLPQMEHDEETQIHLLALAGEAGARVTWLSADTRLDLGSAELQLFAPLGSGGANEEGLSVLAEQGEFHMLLTGDMNTVVEERLVDHAKLPQCQVLVAGHHGSRYASGDTLLNAVRPQNAIISVGENRYGHPAAETLERFAGRGIGVYRTDRQGLVAVQVR